MNKDLTSYVKVYNNWFDKEKCVETIRDIQNKEWHRHEFHYPSENTFITVNGEKELDITNDSCLTSDYLHKRAWDGIHRYITDLSFPWFDSWDGFTYFRFNRYKVDKKMALHCDHIKTAFEGERRGVPVLSLLGILNDDYEGGEFIMWKDTTIELKTGDFLIFPSNFLYPHEVKEVTSGERYTMVSWVW